MTSPKKSSKLRQKIKRLRQINREAGETLVDAAIRKVQLIYQKPVRVLRYVLETVFVFLIALGVFLYFDPTVNWIPTPLNMILFIFVVLIYLYVHFILRLPTDRRN